ncbi:transglutaminase-like domain-containing protein [Arthrobacter castelli]|uniref:transglutaminase-like domain-containing protein n=1 Tax=Arthrobacter castelli TaxID=271431 RepID=UPI0003F7C4F0|nr:transglutaminase family protein [Arthrobacter castelli]
MERNVSAHLSFTTSKHTSIAMAVAVARLGGYQRIDETMDVRVDDEPAEMSELADVHGGRMHTLKLDQPASVTVDYTARVVGSAEPGPDAEMDRIRYVRPSRYCESDKLLPFAYAQFKGLSGADLVLALRRWVHEEFSYVAGSSRPTDGAVETYLQRRGVCRDYAHVVISVLRARDIPARLAAVYAPGLSPMDFHAVVEAYVDGTWQAIDATGMAPRESMVRISTGRDGADTAFLSTVGGGLTLKQMRVNATVDQLPSDDGGELVRLR